MVRASQVEKMETGSVTCLKPLLVYRLNTRIPLRERNFSCNLDPLRLC